MNAYLLYQDKDFPWEEPENKEIEEVFKDLEIYTIINAMANGNKEIESTVLKVLSKPLKNTETIKYRQEILLDCINNPWFIEKVNNIITRVDDEQNRLNRRLGFLKDYPTTLITMSLNMIEIFLDVCRELREVADTQTRSFRSRGFKRLFEQIQHELDASFFSQAEYHLKNCRFDDGMIVTGNIGTGLKAGHYIISNQSVEKSKWLPKFLGTKNEGYTIRIKEKNESDARAFTDLKEKILNSTANILMQSVDHISHFFTMLQKELSFYQGCLNLKKELDKRGMPLCYPKISEDKKISFIKLYDISLSLLKNKIVSNTCSDITEPIILITGANQGGKTTFLRSIGQSFIMGQCGMFVGATSYEASLFNQIRTYFRRAEDRENQSGKLDEELGRIRKTIEELTPGSCLLMNEPFASTNEREGSEIGLDVISALAESDIRVFCVTHFFELTKLFNQKNIDVLYLRAERLEDGRRTFKIKREKPLETGFGLDLYKNIFGID